MKTVLPLIGEYLGTFLVTFTFLASTNPLFIGLIYTIILFLIIPVSGAAVNPAVSFIFYLAGKLGWREALIYSAVQLVAAFTAYNVYAYLA